MIELRGVSMAYRNGDSSGGLESLREVDLHVGAGEFVSVLGPSGCGKTTLINIIAGFAKASSGEVRFDGKPVNGAWLDRIVVFQEHNLFPWKTVSGNVAFGLKGRRVPERDRRAKAQRFIDMVHLTGFEGAYPHQLSGGMKQRAALARALVMEPRCILMDEPLGSLDPQMRETLQVELASLWRETRKTILMVTHDIDEAVFLSERVVVLSPRPGRVRGEIRIDLPHPRTPEMKMTPAFQEFRRRVREALIAEAGTGSAPR